MTAAQDEGQEPQDVGPEAGSVEHDKRSQVRERHLPRGKRVAKHAGEAVDFAQVVKNYSRSPKRVRDGLPSDHRYEPPRDPFIKRTPVYGAPDMTKCSTSHVERLNLDVRMSTRRLTRLCNGFSRKLTHHTAAISLFVAHHNFVRIHGALRVTPAMEAGITDHVWSTDELVERALAHAGEDAAPPVKKPLTMPEVAPDETPAPVRALPNGRGFLRLVTSNDAPERTRPTSPLGPGAREIVRETRNPWEQLNFIFPPDVPRPKE